MTQKEALTILKLGHTTFLTGAAGSGKSTVLREFVSYLKRHDISYALTASTGIAATQVGGQTIHSWSGIGIRDSLSRRDAEELLEREYIYRRLSKVSVIIIDEVSMLHANFIDMLDTLLKELFRNDAPFGGLMIVFCGDFFQLPPVVRGEVNSSYCYAFQASAWKEAKPVCCYLTEQHRQNDGDGLLSVLNAIREDAVDEEHYELLKRRSVHTKEKTLYLHTKNIDVDKENLKEFEALAGEQKSYFMKSSGKQALVQTLKATCLAEEILNLKVGAKIICLKNDPSRHYSNGSLGTVKSFDANGDPVIELTSGKTITFSFASWAIEEDGKVKAEIAQLPLKHAWAITVHKSQGMTLDKAVIDLSHTFASGMGYVALSRLKSLNGLFLAGFNHSAFFIDQTLREYDKRFKQQSERAVVALEKRTPDDLSRLANAFIKKAGGSIIERKLHENADGVTLSTLDKTLFLVQENKSIGEIAKERQLTEETVIGHLEKLHERGENLGDVWKPKRATVKKVAQFLDGAKKLTLKELYELLGGKCTYNEIRLAKLVLLQEAECGDN